MTSLLDTKQRPLTSLRLSVTDRCNLRCQYCMPEENYRWLEREDILSFEELSHIADIFLKLGVKRFRLTGGEPLLRKDLPTLIGLLSTKPGLEDLSLTTNGILLAEQANALKDAGLHRITLSLDTLDPTNFEKLTRRAQFGSALQGLEAAQRAGFDSIKINTVVIKGFNDHEVGNLLRFSKEHKVMVRFIEYMDVGGATKWEESQVVSQRELLSSIENEFGPVRAMANRGSIPAQTYVLDDGTPFGIIASTTAPFCGSCDRARITADGTLLTCLYGTTGFDLRTPLRSGQSEEMLLDEVRQVWRQRSDAGALERLQMGTRGPLVPLPILQNNPHLEMHTRGG